MKKTVLIFLVAITTLQVVAQQEANKPIYNIQCFRNDFINDEDTLIGNIVIELFPLVAPKHVRNFDSLVSVQFYDSTAFHRVVPGFVIQGGDPNSRSGPVNTWGYGQSSQPKVPAEFTPARHYRGRMGAARGSDINSATSQFYFSVANTFNLDNNYTVYGQLVSGHSVMDLIVSAPRNSNDRPLEKISMFVTKIGEDSSVANAPTLTSPANNATGVTATANFQWTDVSAAVLYRMEFSTDSTFAAIDAVKDAGVNQGTAPTTLLGSTTYFWRIRTNNGGHYSQPSNVFKIKTAATVPTLIYPSNNSTNIPISPLCNWNDIPNSTYQFQLSTTTNFIAGTILIDTNNLTDSQYQLSNLNSNTAYFWRARSYDGQDYSNWPVRARFVTETVAGIDNRLSLLNSIKLYPNPVNDILNVEINASTNIKITDTLGKLLLNTSYEAGTHQLELNGFAKGIYFISLELGTNIYHEKITIE